MKILMLCSGDRAPSSRFRMYPYVVHFRHAGHQCRVANSFPQKYDWIPWLGFRPSQLLKRGVRYCQWWRSRLQGDEIVIVEREIFDNPTFDLEKRFHSTAGKLVLDLDDGVFLRYPEKFEQLARLADLIVCGNPFIQEWAASRNPRTLLLPTCVEMARYKEKVWSSNPDRVTQIGWIGTTGNLQYLQVAAPALRHLAREYLFELVVIAGSFEPLEALDLSGVSVRKIVWNPETEMGHLGEFDIGLMPLHAHSEWDKYKCGLKLIQYMAIGIPAVASPVGVNSTIVTHGQNGFIASTDEEWEAYLRQLLVDDQLRRAVGVAARVTASEKYSIEANYPRYEAALLEMMSSNR
jgi:glycosyltransferase involved in cell wall biosynthesis